MSKSDLEKAVDEYIEYNFSPDWNPDRDDKYVNCVFEAAIKHFKGPGIWDEIYALPTHE